MNPAVLEKYRVKKGLTITEVAHLMGKTPGWYSRIKDGKQGLPSKHIAPLANVLGVKAEKLAKEYFSDDQLDDTSSFRTLNEGQTPA